MPRRLPLSVRPPPSIYSTNNFSFPIFNLLPHHSSNIYFSVHFDDLNGNLSFTDYKIEMEEVSGAINPDDLKEVGHDEWVANVAGLKNLLKWRTQSFVNS